MRDLPTTNRSEIQRHIIKSTSKVIYPSVLFELAYPLRISNSSNIIIFLRVSKGKVNVFCRSLVKSCCHRKPQQMQAVCAINLWCSE
jgi:hypothetical protein